MQVLQTVSGQTNINEKIVTVMRGVAKVYVGELVEAGKMCRFSHIAMPVESLSLSLLCTAAARLFAHENGESGPLQPAHYLAAYQQLNLQGKIPHKTASKQLKL